jgi:AGZA family xanthine/uracil permease-like MFS transporter
VTRELRGGLTTFVAMAYIVLLNPLILASATDVTGAKLSLAQLVTATALSATVMTIIMGLVGNVPLALAAGLGVNGVVAFQIAASTTWAEAFGLVVLMGITIVVLVVTGLRSVVMNAIPRPLKSAITVGIGMFLTLIGLVNAGFVTRTPDAAKTSVPVRLGIDGHLEGWPVAVFCIGLVLMIVLYGARVPGAILISIAATTVIAIVVNAVFEPKSWGGAPPEVPDKVVSAPDFGLFGQIDLFGAFGRVGVLTAGVFLFTLVLSGFFDAMGTILAVGDDAGLVDEKGKLPGMGRVLFIDGASAAFGGLAGNSANTVFLESAAGVREGARTGLSSVVCGVLFGLTLFVAPLAAIVPSQAAASALVLIGGLMAAQLRHIDWDDIEIAVPAFLTITLMPFTYSITNGVGAGLIAYTLLKAARGKWREPGPLVWITSLVFVVYFAVSGLT